jgi:hypothetical protein
MMKVCVGETENGQSTKSTNRNISIDDEKRRKYKVLIGSNLAHIRRSFFPPPFPPLIHLNIRIDSHSNTIKYIMMNTQVGELVIYL